MTDAPGVEVDHIHFSAYREFDSEEEVVEALHTLERIEKPELYRNQVFDIDDSIIPTVTFADASKENFLQAGFSYYEPNTLAVSGVVTKPHIDDFSQLYLGIQEAVGELEPSDAHVLLNIEKKFSDIDVVEFESKLDVTGFKVSQGGLGFIVQRADGTTRVNCEPESFGEDFSPEQLTDVVEKSEAFGRNL